jgi:hypothetical protein
LYDLFGGDPPRPIAEDIRDFGYKVMKTAGSLDGSLFVVDGWGGPGWTHRTVAAFDGLTGKQRWPVESHNTNRVGSTICIDPSGNFVAASLDLGAPPHRLPLLDAQTGLPVGDFRGFNRGALGPGAESAIGCAIGEGYQLLRRGDAGPLVELGMDSPISSYLASFNAAGTHAAWGNADGTVTVCNLAEVRRRLDLLRLAWPE